jgi:hypothetical protein
MKRLVLLVLFAVASIVLAGCTAGAGTSSPAATPRTSTTSVAPSAVRTATVPNDLVGKTMGEAKAELTKAGFTNIVVAGGDLTDDDKVTSAPEAGQTLVRTAKVRLIGAAAVSEQQGTQDACWADATQCYMDGQQCATGSCVNAARGLSPADVQRQTQEWLSQHPGYCAYGETGGIGLCSDSSTSSDAGFR